MRKVLLTYDSVQYVLFTFKVLGGIIRKYKNYKQITLMKFIILFLLKK